MIKKTVKYVDYNGEERTGEYFFNLNKFELMKMEMGTAGGFAERVQRIVKAQDAPSILAIFEDLICKSYGVKTVDGGFVKRPEDLEAFKASEAYSELCMELCMNPDAAAEFVNGVIPANMTQDGAPNLAPVN